MDIAETCQPDVMQVCFNGHVITELLRTHPDRGLSRCDRCGADTLSRCLTCGQELAGAIPVPGLMPLGSRQPPAVCAACGAAFPWTRRRSTPPPDDPLALLENLLRRLPRVVRQLRSRHGDRPPFRVEDEHDLEDLLRALLPLHFDDVRPEGRTPGYAADVRTDFRVMPEGVAMTAKRVTSTTRVGQVAAEIKEDAAYYQRQQACRRLIVLVYDPGQHLPNPRGLEVEWSGVDDGLEVRCLITV